MVQGGSSAYCTKTPCDGHWDNSARKSGFEALQKKQESEKREAQKKSQYGAWGPTFKNKKNFSEMHFC